MDDIPTQEKLRAIGANLLMIVGLLFATGGLILKEGIFSFLYIRYTVLGIGVVLFLISFKVRFSKGRSDPEYV
ncbi:MAG: hypothetical protein ACOCWQ_02900 [Nanoarchaeota archaeon]